MYVETKVRYIWSLAGPVNRVPGPFNPNIPPPLENTWMMPPTSAPPLNFLNFPPPDLVSQDKEPLQRDSPRVPSKHGWSAREGEGREGQRHSKKRDHKSDSLEGRKNDQVTLPHSRIN